MSFNNAIVGANDTLVRNAIQSENFVTGVSGWRIEKTGDAEFNDVDVRGRVEIGPDNGPQVIIDSTPAFGFIEFPTHVVSEDPNLPASIASAGQNIGMANEYASLQIDSAVMQGATDRVQLELNSQNNDGTSEASFAFVHRTLLGVNTALVICDTNSLLLGSDNIRLQQNGGAPVSFIKLNASTPVQITQGPLEFGGTVISQQQRGKRAINFAAISSQVATVTFPTAFTAIPTLTLGIETGNNATDYCCKFRQLTTAGFTLVVRERANTAVTDNIVIHWWAQA